ncbi:uncharacterized protein LOC110826036 [Carica papaya]|uniref:uncharacterized protein LOC110826036 n=1 Tax=Carica papaya TaxID=3649 RepID=UPI000B8CAF02|nr:uncharacterized protein LOC110826036 [Carica papaya]
MAGNGTSWADQWDYNSDPSPYTTKNTTESSTGAGKYKQKVGEGIGKTKAVASSGFKKVKEGTSVGLQWVKDKYHKTTQKH